GGHMTYSNCMQTEMHARGALMPPKTAMQQTTVTVKLDYVGSAKTRLMATDETEKQQKQNPEPFRVVSMSGSPDHSVIIAIFKSFN
ncbi:MAG: hypothetical protein QW177_09090, partial [Candidatus Nitrosotenuis sp.]